MPAPRSPLTHLQPLTLLLCAACTPASLFVPTDSQSTGPDSEDSRRDSAKDSPADTAPEQIPPREEEIGDQPPDDGAAVFDQQILHQIEIQLPPESYTALIADPYVLADASVTIDGEEIPEIGLRLRGKIGSFREVSAKPKFRIDFNARVEDQRFYGLEGLNLNNSVVDCSYLKEPLGYAIFAAAGVPALRTAFAQVTVNGLPYGLYVMVEEPDDRFLRRTYPDPTGNLYDGKYVWYGGYNYTLLDFNSGVDELYQLEEGTDVDNADIAAVSAALAAAAGQPTFYAQMAAVLDWPEYHRQLAAEQWSGHNDGYALNTNNYRLYFNPQTGLMEVLPWDFDYGFLVDSDWGMSWASPRGKLAASCFADEICAAAHRQAVSDLLTTLDATDWAATLRTWQSLTADAALNDPRRECDAASVTPSQDALIAYVQRRSSELRSFWGL